VPGPFASKRRRWIAAGLVLLLAALVLGGYLYKRNRTGNVYNPHARFVDQPSPAAPRADAARVDWPLYGYTKNHTRYFPASSRLFPPYRVAWIHYGGKALLEFPPTLAGQRIFQLADDGVLRAIDSRNGHTLWQRRLGLQSASTPAVAGGVVYATVLERSPGVEAGAIYAVQAATGRPLWTRDLPSPSESSPLVDDGRVFFGSQDGTVYALEARDGRVVWTYHAEGAVKASPTLAGGVLYFGDYSGHVQAISERTGSRLWDTASEGALLGSGTFYSTAAVMYGRVYLGNTDGRVYAFDAGSGRLDWAVQTGAYVYSSPAVTSAPGLGPTIYIGSYSGTFYALNARSGGIDWQYETGGRISGSPTIVGRVVYLAALGTHHTYGLGISTGRLVFEKATGSFDPVISDGQDIYLTGTTGLYCLAPAG